MSQLDVTFLRAALRDSLLGHRIIVLESTRSTNDFLLQMLMPTLEEGVVVFAEHQTAGRGQRANRWESAARQGLWFSILLRPRFSIIESVRLTSWAARGVAATIQHQIALEPVIKSPNDVYVGSRKVAGVLVDTKAGSGTNFASIVGIGVNINQPRLAFPEALRERAGSLAMALGQPVSRSDFAVALLQELDRTYAEINGSQSAGHSPHSATADKPAEKSPTV